MEREDLADLGMVFVLVDSIVQGENMRLWRMDVTNNLGQTVEVVPLFRSQERVLDALDRYPDWPKAVYATTGEKILETVPAEAAFVLDP